MNYKWINIIKKYNEYGVIRLKIIKDQKRFMHNGVELKYMYQPIDNSNVLLIVFSACTRVGLGARYNYVKILEHINCSQLFILDDFGEDKRGSYYLGRMPEFNEQSATLSLIQSIIQKEQAKKVIFCGSCKGGYAALNFGSQFENSIMIIGEPTYHIATEFEKAESLMHYWLGTITEERIHELDNYLARKLYENNNITTQRIYLFYSSKDEYYERHTEPLLRDLRNSGYELVTEEATFKMHSELALWFPDFLKKSIGEHIDKWNN